MDTEMNVIEVQEENKEETMKRLETYLNAIDKCKKNTDVSVSD